METLLREGRRRSNGGHRAVSRRRSAPHQRRDRHPILGGDVDEIVAAPPSMIPDVPPGWPGWLVGMGQGFDALYVATQAGVMERCPPLLNNRGRQIP